MAMNWFSLLASKHVSKLKNQVMIGGIGRLVGIGWAEFAGRGRDRFDPKSRRSKTGCSSPA
jgi:hypothetical protein